MEKANKMNMEAANKVQKDIGDTLEEANRYWAARAKSEVELMTDLFGKLTGAKSIPEATAAYQEWAGGRMQRFADDSQKFVADCQKFASTWTRLAGNGGLPGSS